MKRRLVMLVLPPDAMAALVVQDEHVVLRKAFGMAKRDCFRDGNEAASERSMSVVRLAQVRRS